MEIRTRSEIWMVEVYSGIGGNKVTKNSSIIIEIVELLEKVIVVE